MFKLGWLSWLGLAKKSKPSPALLGLNILWNIRAQLGLGLDGCGLSELGSVQWTGALVGAGLSQGLQGTCWSLTWQGKARLGTQPQGEENWWAGGQGSKSGEGQQQKRWLRSWAASVGKVRSSQLAVARPWPLWGLGACGGDQLTLWGAGCCSAVNRVRDKVGHCGQLF